MQRAVLLVLHFFILNATVNGRDSARGRQHWVQAMCSSSRMQAQVRESSKLAIRGGGSEDEDVQKVKSRRTRSFPAAGDRQQSMPKFDAREAGETMQSDGDDLDIDMLDEVDEYVKQV